MELSMDGREVSRNGGGLLRGSLAVDIAWTVKYVYCNQSSDHETSQLDSTPSKLIIQGLFTLIDYAKVERTPWMSFMSQSLKPSPLVLSESCSSSTRRGRSSKDILVSP